MSLKIIDELNLKDEDKILDIGKVVYDSIEFAISVSNEEDSEKLVDLAYQYFIDKSTTFNIELTENRKELARQLITIGIKNRLVNID